MKKFKISYCIFLLFITVIMSRCVQHKELLLFPENTVQLKEIEKINNSIELRAQPDDLLRISVHSSNLEAAAPFNLEPVQIPGNQMMQQSQNGNQGNYQLELFNGYFVDKEGSINFPILGKLIVEGLTIPEIETKILESVKPFLKDAIVNVRFLNFKITVLGEVNRPGNIRVSNQRINIIEAIGLAGDFTSYANRTNILLIRERNGERIYQRFDFQDDKLFDSQYFYLQQNDVLYVEPIRAKVATVQDPFARGVTYGSAFLTIITLIFALLR